VEVPLRWASQWPDGAVWIVDAFVLE